MFPEVQDTSSPSLRSSRVRGFTLLELIIVIAIIAILAGVVTPVASTMLKSKSRSATRSELEVLSDAGAEYFRDTGTFPTSLMDLSVSPGTAGWSGPYIHADSVDAQSGGLGSVIDAWSNPYALTVLSESSLRITSAGEDGTIGTSTDISRTLDVTPIRREETLAVLGAVNQAITQYNSLYLPDSPLPSSYGSILSTLASAGFLPATTPFAADGWGDALVPYPAGQTPVVQVASTHLEAGTGTGTGGASFGGSGNDEHGQGNGGDGHKKDKDKNGKKGKDKDKDKD